MSYWFREEKKPRKRPDWIAPAIWKKTTGVFTCMQLGVQYRFAITPETRPFASLIRGNRDPWGPRDKTNCTGPRRAMLAESGMLDIINCLLCQVRDTAVADAATMLAQDIQTRLHPLLAAKINSNIDGKLQRLESGAGASV